MDGSAPAPKPPDDLRKRGRGRKFWKQVVAEFELAPHEAEMLAEACRCLDHCDRLREQLEDAPLLVDGKTHPLVIELRLTRNDLRLLLTSMGWGDEVETTTTRRARHAAAARWQR